MTVHDLLIVGAGPSGLATAIAAARQGFDYQVIEKGALVDAILRFPVHMAFFTTPELLEIGGLPLTTSFDKPTRLEALRYYRRVVETFGLQVTLGEEVFDIQREPVPGEPDARFAVHVRSRRGVRRVVHARALVLAIGYYDNPNLLGIPGEDLPHVSHYYREAHPYYRQQVVVVGGKNSAAETALELYRAGAHVTLVHRRAALGDSIKYWVKPDLENRIRAGSIPARFETRVVEIRPTSVVVEHAGQREELPADAVFLLTGYHADTRLFTAAGVELTARGGPRHNPETMETNVPNVFVAGGAVAGLDTGAVFIENGRFHGERIVEVLARRRGR
ncbi:MAG: YpdA family putative bacillithiol disulfide reductase [Acidobacteriota bacterium]|nr:YpdA family putative bacillithiol disulfide reductase [Acidobacteriota bacterium]